MKKILIIPIITELENSLRLAERYSAGFEFNDFFNPDVLDSPERLDSIISRYKENPLPELRTIHGAFFDVTVFSPDKRIREVSDLRVRQSIDAARRIGAKAVVFHTNYNPFLSSSEYVERWTGANAAYWSDILDANPDIDIYLENMFDASPYILADLSDRLKGHKNYGVCLDYAHAALSVTPHSEWVKKLGRYVKHIHLNDNDLFSDGHLALGEGRIDFNEFYRLFDKYMNSASILIETSFISRQLQSLERLKADGFIE